MVHDLEHSWTLWYHSTSEDRWDLSSYIRIETFRTVEEVYSMMDLLQQVSDRWGHFFLMRDDILPMYEDPAHVDGGSWSFKVHQRKRLPDAWSMFVAGILGGFLIHPSLSTETITGLSVNPRNGVIKVWTSLHADTFPLLDHSPWVHQERSMFQPHRQKI